MASCAGWSRSGSRVACPWLCFLAFFSSLSLGPAVQGRRMICWQAIMQCRGDSDCSYAYNQYTSACGTVLRGEKRRCPSHCISALIQLNNTRTGPALEDCDCVDDETCKKTKSMIEPCMPRTSNNTGGVMGCTQARRECEKELKCSMSLSKYLSHCGNLFNGLQCTESCKAVIEDMLSVPKAVLLNECVCDGLERPICESLKENMAKLCFDSDLNNPGSSGAEGYDDEDYDEYEGDISPAALSSPSSPAVVASIFFVLLH
uniref:Growth arrest specific 1 n=1 Tax=Latimeria chalumnae TaxID=7897 RepID=H2ZTL1_LATCH